MAYPGYAKILFFFVISIKWHQILRFSKLLKLSENLGFSKFFWDFKQKIKIFNWIFYKVRFLFSFWWFLRKFLNFHVCFQMLRFGWNFHFFFHFLWIFRDTQIYNSASFRFPWSWCKYPSWNLMDASSPPSSSSWSSNETRQRRRFLGRTHFDTTNLRIW